MRKHGLTHIEPKTEAVDAWVEEVNAAAEATLLPQAKHSWYLGANVPGKPRVFMPFLGYPRYVELSTKVAEEGYAGFQLA